MRKICDNSSKFLNFKIKQMSKILGIDVGGSSLKSAIVNTETGSLTTDVFVVKNNKMTSAEFPKLIKKIVNHFGWTGKIGCGFPAVIQKGVVKNATNIDKGFVHINLESMIEDELKLPCKVVNDADAAATAEFTFGNAKDFEGIKLMLTLGTGIGSALFKKELIPNLEFGLLTMKNGKMGEKYCAASVKTREKLSYEVWAKRFNEYLLEVDALLNPHLIIIGGGISKDYDKFEQYLDLRNKIEIATFLNNAGIVGAALANK